MNISGFKRVVSGFRRTGHVTLPNSSVTYSGRRPVSGTTKISEVTFSDAGLLESGPTSIHHPASKRSPCGPASERSLHFVEMPKTAPILFELSFGAAIGTAAAATTNNPAPPLLSHPLLPLLIAQLSCGPHCQ